MAAVVNSYITASSTPASITLVGSSYVSNVTTSGIPFPSGTAVGDIALAMTIGSSGSPYFPWSGGGTFGIGYAEGAAYSTKVLTSTDISAGGVSPFYLSGSGLLVVYRNATAASVKATLRSTIDPDTGYPISTTSYSTSFTKGTGSKKLVALTLTLLNLGTIVPPFTTQSSTSSYNHSDMNSSLYTNGSTLTTSWTTSDYRIAQVIFELT